MAVSAADAAQIERTSDAIAKLSLIWLGLTNRLTAAVAPALETVATALAEMARGTRPIGGAITAVIDNLARLAPYAATFAAFMAGRWVAGLAVAALSVRGLATALVIMRGALIRTGIGALIVGAGELVYQFSQLVARVGGVSAGRFGQGGLVAYRPVTGSCICQHGRWLGGAEGGRAVGARRHHRGRRQLRRPHGRDLPGGL